MICRLFLATALLVSPYLALADALHDAARRGSPNQIRKLLAAGHDVNAHLLIFGLTPLDVARQNDHSQSARVLSGKGGRSFIDVARVQAALTLLGYDPGPIDGLIGRSTWQAVRAFQQAQKLEEASSWHERWLQPLQQRTVEHIQRTLTTVGFNPGPVDGLLGPSTHRAVERFRRSIKLDGDDIDTAFMQALAKQKTAAQRAPTTAPVISAPESIAAGDTQALQQALLTLGYEPGPADGEKGPTTQAAVRQFQRDHNLAVDGIAGPQVRQTLMQQLTQHQRTQQIDVLAVQKKLAALDYNPGPVDGVMGPATQQAIKRFANDHALQSNDDLEMALNKALNGAIQQQLVRLGLDPGPVDGKIGPQTRRALERFRTKWSAGNTAMATPTSMLELMRRSSSQSLEEPLKLAPAPPSSDNELSPQWTRTVQTRLRQVGLYNGRIDGKPGPATRRAIFTFQQRENLPTELDPAGSWVDVLRRRAEEAARAGQTQTVTRRQSTLIRSTPPGQARLVSGRLKLHRDGQGRITGCTVGNLNLEANWCSDFARNDNDQCTARLRSGGRVASLRCS